MKKTTKKQLKDKCKKILNKKTHLTDKEKSFLMRIFEQHPTFELKKGVGIKDIYVGKAHYGTKCFFFLRNDGSSIDISYNVAINGEKKKAQKIAQACRTAIKPIIENERANINWGVDKCALTDEILREGSTHIDHYDYDFAVVVRNWIELRGEDRIFKYINKNTANDIFVETHFVDERVINDFIEYHNANTHLRAVTAQANLRRSKS